MKKTCCEKVELKAPLGVSKIYVDKRKTVLIDKCIVDLVKELWNRKIYCTSTVGNCDSILNGRIRVKRDKVWECYETLKELSDKEWRIEYYDTITECNWRRTVLMKYNGPNYNGPDGTEITW